MYRHTNTAIHILVLWPFQL